MNRYLLAAGGVVTLLMAAFKVGMPYLFGWQGLMSEAAPEMWAILYAENLGISLLLLFFAYMSIFRWEELSKTALGKVVLLSMTALWLFRAIAEAALFKIGADGAWWRLGLFLTLALIYLAPISLAGWIHKATPNIKSSNSSLDEVLPESEFGGTQFTRVRATPEQVFSAIWQVTASDMPLAMVLIWLRYLPVRLLGKKIENTPANQPIMESVLRYYTVLREQPDRELIIGQVGRLDKIIQHGVSISSREEFASFNHPDYQKYALGIQIDGSEDAGEVKLVIEQRLHAPGKAARGGFARYWIVIRPMSAFMLRMLLGAIRRRAERNAELLHVPG